ncbi:uncharacterized protein DUF1992 [Asanoa ferruginea]|uniref:Uncharacterized protein DUF1992 n=1 Tax=Asanoa ferruginea TaxID=53367 RepID=A0A3D9ZYF4_9ACTN|nr:DUF1992 domain-containing protein [Asanoa ferruginea]REG01685.1 uncharacterized protein DUF1992 [Asanoa ferruginea]GIF51696.1 hypothetical protein Afe04nite_62350 [Asanoa ferruginea]
MSDRIESLIDARIRAARENGEFDDLPGAGKPLPGHAEPYDEQWWLKEFARREGISAAALLPLSVQLARLVEQLPDEVRRLPSEQRVRETVADLNREILDYQIHPSQPFLPIKRVDVEAMVTLWREALEARFEAARQQPPPAADRRKRRWLRRGRSETPDHP